MSLTYVASMVAPGAQLSAVLLDWLPPSEESPPLLVLNRLNHLQFYTSPSAWQSPADHTLLYDVPVQGSIVSIQQLKIPGQPTSSLLVLTAANDLFLLAHAPGTPSPSIETVSSTSIHENYARLAEYSTLQVDPGLRCIVAHVYSGLLRVIPLPSSMTASSSGARRKSSSASSVVDLSKGYSLRLPSLNLVALAFHPSSSSSDNRPAIATISIDHASKPQLQYYAVDIPEKEIVPLSTTLPNSALQDPGAEILIPVRNEDRDQGDEEGLLVVGEEWIAWVSSRTVVDSGPGDDNAASAASREDKKGKGKGKRRASSSSSCCPTTIGVRIPVSAVKTWTKIRGQNDQYLLGDLYGNLSQLSIVRNNVGKVTALSFADLGDTSSPTTLLSLTPSVVYVASRFADSQFVRLPLPSSSGGDEDESITVEGAEGAAAQEIELLASFPSLAPILDCCLVTSEGENTSVVTCSGAYKGGSLRIVKQGVGLAELANLEIEGIRQLWSLKTTEADLLVLGFFTETKVLAFSASLSEDEEDDSIEEIDVPHFDLYSPTILATAFHGAPLQVTSDAVRFKDGQTFSAETVGGKFTLAAAIVDATEGEEEDGCLACAAEGGNVVLVAVKPDGQLSSVGTTKMGNEVACVSSSSLSGKPVLVVGLWVSQTVVVLSVPSLEPVLSVEIPSSFLIRSVQLLTFSNGVTQLFAGMGDGTLVSYVISQEREGNQFVVNQTTRKAVTLGRQPIFMVPFETKEGTGKSLFVSSERPTIVSRIGDKVKYAAVNLKGITAATPFSAASFPKSLALASPSGLRIGRIEDIQSVDIRTVSLGDDEPRRIAYDSQTDTFGVLCTRREIDRATGNQELTCSFKVFDGKSFEVVSSTPMNGGQVGESVAVVPTDDETSSYVVGTSQASASDTEPSSGQLLVFSPSSSGGKDFSLKSQLEINGCPYAIAHVEKDLIAVAIQSQVIVYRLSGDGIEANPLATWSGKFISLTLSAVAGSNLVVGDGIGSLTLLHYASTPKPRLEEVARDHRTLYITAASALDTQSATSELVGADADLNLFSVKTEDVTTTRSTLVKDQILAPRGVFHLGELVSKFCPGSFVQQYGDEAGFAVPRLVYATSAGSLGIIAEVKGEKGTKLIELERNMRTAVKTIGNLSQEEWRSFKSETQKVPPAGFLDGNFLQQASGLSNETMSAVIAGGSLHERLEMESHELLKLVEELGRLH